LLLLCIEAGRLSAAPVDEESEPGQEFPHLYGPLNLDAVVEVLPFEPLTDGHFLLPESVHTLSSGRQDV